MPEPRPLAAEGENALEVFHVEHSTIQARTLFHVEHSFSHNARQSSRLPCKLRALKSLLTVTLFHVEQIPLAKRRLIRLSLVLNGDSNANLLYEFDCST